MDDKVTVHEGRRVGSVVSVRLKPEEAELLEALSERDGRTLSETLRLALHEFARSARRPSVGLQGDLPLHTRGEWVLGELIEA